VEYQRLFDNKSGINVLFKAVQKQILKDKNKEDGEQKLREVYRRKRIILSHKAGGSV